MMNTPADVARALSMWEYEALLWHWNDAHSGNDYVGPPDPEIAMAILERANANPALIH